ncbi:hypothetical protein [Tolypothrix sp. NIES-4075]|uniref:hypothetical protein n=1 Tax=Tolypothrix sp. NIES-4075 TaxID=2005459 RepID=UPI00117E3348|nr:hypothetical protein [Tolypothrix sp. NIES-4075]
MRPAPDGRGKRAIDGGLALELGLGGFSSFYRNAQKPLIDGGLALELGLGVHLRGASAYDWVRKTSFLPLPFTL